MFCFLFFEQSASCTPVRKVCREQQFTLSPSEKLDTSNADYEQANNERQSDSEAEESNQVQNKIKRLLEEVCKQQQVIAQTSQALNLCAATIEFSGSTESVEGERHLLVASK